MVKKQLHSKGQKTIVTIIAIIAVVVVTGVILSLTLFSLSSRIQNTLRETVVNYRELNPSRMISSHEESLFVDYQYNATFQLDSSSVKSFFEYNPMAKCASHNVRCTKTMQGDVVIWTYSNESENISATLTADRQKQQVYWTYSSY